MARLPRGEVIKQDESGLYHCWTSTVRSLKILAPEHNGKSRRDWVIDRAEGLARWFGISIAFYSVLDNHYHFVFQTLPDVVKKWTDKQVIKRSSKITLGSSVGWEFAVEKRLPSRLPSLLKTRNWWQRTVLVWRILLGS